MSKQSREDERLFREHYGNPHPKPGAFYNPRQQHRMTPRDWSVWARVMLGITAGAIWTYVLARCVQELMQ